jgi:hypothetical protein
VSVTPVAASNAIRLPGARFSGNTRAPVTGKATGASAGYVVDHVVPLKRGGADTPGNMAWQTTAGAKAKDGIE